MEIRWEAYEFVKNGLKFVYSMPMSEEKLNNLWNEFKKWEGSQEEFYFQYVNPMKFARCLREVKLKDY